MTKRNCVGTSIVEMNTMSASRLTLCAIEGFGTSDSVFPVYIMTVHQPIMMFASLWYLLARWEVVIIVNTTILRHIPHYTTI